jgi:hypothetical protein
MGNLYKNGETGVLLGKRLGDFVAGSNSPIQSDLNVDNWIDYKPEHELQNTGGFETFTCVSFSANDILETLFMYYLRNNMISPQNTRWLVDNGYFRNGFINFSDRFVAINGKTETIGAYQYLVGDGINKNGLIPESMLPMGGHNQSEYLDSNVITKEMVDLGKEFLKRFTINYEWVDDLKDALKKSPVQVVVRWANYTNPTDILDPTGNYCHAVMAFKETDDYIEINDSYTQEIKRYAVDQPISFMAYHLTINNENTMDTNKFIKDNDLKFVRNSNTGAFGRVLQGKLRTFSSTDRAVLCLLDDEIRKGGVQITNAEWEQLPKADF